jgi:hypothetical protein
LAFLVLGTGATVARAQEPEAETETTETPVEIEEGLGQPLPSEPTDIDEILQGDEALFGGTEGYTYDPGGRRDPFKSLLAVVDQQERRGPRPEGIPGLLIDEVRLIGILTTSKGTFAQVQAADKQLSYLLKEGDQLFDGEVVSIEGDEVVFRQIVQDPTAPKPFRERVKTLNPTSP